MTHRFAMVARLSVATATMLLASVGTAQEAVPLLAPIYDFDSALRAEEFDFTVCYPYTCYDQIALDGDRFVGVGSGRIFVFERDAAGAWGFRVALDPTPESDEGSLGAIAVDGDEILVAGAASEIYERLEPKLHVFRRTKAGWEHRQALSLETCEGGLTALQLESGTALAGNCVYERDCHGNYSFAARLEADDGAALAQPYTATAFDGRTALFGLPYADAEVGVAYVFRQHGSRWWQVARLTPPDGDGAVRFGDAVAVDGSDLVIGAPWAPGVIPERSGVAHLYTRSGRSLRHTGVVANPFLHEPGWMRSFGAYLALDAGRLLGGSGDMPGRPIATEPGAFLFERSGSSFVPVALLDAPQPLVVLLSGRNAIVATATHHGSFSPMAFDVPVASCE